MYAKLYNYNETNFDSLGLGVLKDTISGKVTHERNGQYDLELEYPVNSRLTKYLKKNNIIKADAGKRFKGQLFRIYKINKTLENSIKVYANHITCDLQDNFIPKIDLKNVSCINALNSIKNNVAFEIPFKFSTDITHSANFSIERVDALSCLGGTEGSIIDTYGNGANIIRDNFNISIMQNYGQDNNVLIAYKKNMLSLDVDDEGDIVTGIYPFFISQEGINSETETVSSFIELSEKYLYRSDYKNFEKQKVIAVDFSNSSIASEDDLREKARKYFSSASTETLNIKVDFLDETSLSNIDNVSQLKTLDVYDYVIIRHIGLDLNYKSKITKVVYDFISEEYESLEIGEKRTNLATDTVTREDSFKEEINKTNNFWQQAIEHATSQITGNSGGYVKMYPPDKPAEIFIMDSDDENLAVHVLRMNKEGIGFSKNGINGPFETAWTADGTFYADFITAGTINADLIKAGVLSGIKVESRGEGSRVDMEEDGIKFHSDDDCIGKVSFDNNGAGTIDEAKNRLWVRTLLDYALKLETANNSISISCPDDRNVYIKNMVNIGTVNGKIPGESETPKTISKHSVFDIIDNIKVVNNILLPSQTQSRETINVDEYVTQEIVDIYDNEGNVIGERINSYVNNSSIIALLLNAIKELKQEIKLLKIEN